MIHSTKRNVAAKAKRDAFRAEFQRERSEIFNPQPVAQQQPVAAEQKPVAAEQKPAQQPPQKQQQHQQHQQHKR